MNLKHRLVDRHNNNNNNTVPPAPTAANHSSSKDLYEDDHERPLLDTTETDSLDLTHMSGGGGGGGGGGQAAPEVGEGGELVVNSPESLLSSPGRPQPVKFDFNAVDAAKASGETLGGFFGVKILIFKKNTRKKAMKVIL